MDTQLKRIRDKKGDSTYTVAKKLGINQRTYYLVEQGERTVDRELAEKIAEYSELPMESVCFIAYCRYKMKDGVTPAKRTNKKKAGQ